VTAFDKLSAKLGKRKGVTNPKALAAYIGMKSLGKAEFERRSKAGRAKAARR
jgi:hypothetical protein